MRLKGGEAVVKTLLNCNVATVYGEPGTHVIEIYEALRNEPYIKHVLAMHEANAAFMADAHGRLTGHACMPILILMDHILTSVSIYVILAVEVVLAVSIYLLLLYLLRAWSHQDFELLRGGIPIPSQIHKRR